MKGRIRIGNALASGMRSTPIEIFRQGMAIILLVCFTSASILPTAFASTKEKAPLSVSKNVPRPVKTKPIFAARPQANTLLPGQTVTLLGDGRSLLIGGEIDKCAVDAVSLSDAFTGAPVAIKSKLRQARAWHSATTLPDGSVLVLGGTGKNGEVLKSAELFDPERQTFTLMPVPEIAAQAYHTATLLTDGQVLITGGTGQTLLWDFRTKTFRALTTKPSATRQKHKATLLFDGNLLLEGGVDNNGNQVTTAELFNAGSGSFNFTTISTAQMDQSGPFLSGSLPANGAGDVPVDALMALRFSKRLRVETLNSHSITLSGTEGTLEAKVVAAESGRLAFVTPKVPLLAGMTYSVSIADAVDESGAAIAPASTTFTTKGLSEPSGKSADSDVWNPDWTNFKGNWTNKHEDSPWRSLPLLKAAAGVTALAGQVLTLDGKPLENTTLRIGSNAVQTDKTGRFLLSDLAAGHQVMVIDGRSASRNKKVYGTFKYGVELTAGKTNPLGFTIWMPRLDTNNVVTLLSPTKDAVKVTNPAIPGLELRLPQGTVIRDLEGKTVTEVSITPIPTNQPPFPLPPNVDVPVYFTIQPGGSQIIPPRAQLIYPNFINSPANTRIDFYNYDAAEKGWYIYGKGTVTPDGKQIVPDAGVTLYEFSGAMVAAPSLAPGTFVMCGRGNFGGAGVDLGSGLFVNGHSDMSIGGFGSLSLSRVYRPNDTRSRAFGVGSSHIYDTYLVGSTFPYTFMDLVGPDGSRIHFNRTSAGTSWTDAVYESESCGMATSCAVKATIRWNGGGWIVLYEDGTKLIFPEGFGAGRAEQSAIIGFEDPFGNAFGFVRDGASNLTRITSTSGRSMDFTYDASNRIIQARDNIGRVVGYSYDTSGRLASVTNPMSGVQSYTYDASQRMTQITDERGVAVLKNEYDSAGRIIKQTFGDTTPDPNDNPSYTYGYTLDSGGRTVQTDVTDPQGLVRRVTFDANGFTTSDTYGLGLPEQQLITYERETGTNRLLSVTDSIGRKVAYTYDSVGRVTDVTSLAGTAEAITTHYGYSQGCNCNDPTSITDPLNRTSNFGYDSKQNLTSVTDPLGHTTTIAYNSAGHPVSTRDALDNLTQLTYENGDVVGMTDARGGTTSTFIDSAGRLLSSRGPTGQLARVEYDALSRPVKTVNRLGGITEFTYDANSNLLSVKDPRNNVTAYSYDNMNRQTSRTDPLGHIATYEYDAVGGLKQFTDARGKVTAYGYDNFYRLVFVGFGKTGDPANPVYESTITYTYDTLGRLVEIVDSASGTISYTYDNLDRLISETTSQGSVSYSYDAANRKTSMTVAGQAPVNYTYDNADRLTQLTQAGVTVSFTYDDAGRILSVSQTNGIVNEFTYDAASNLTSITYRKDSLVLGNLTYEYDAAGKRTKVGGTFARTGMPQSLTVASYNGANQLTERGSATLTYDQNGNLTSDGTNAYAWNARNQLASITSSGLAARFQYDALGRRVNKTINGQSTTYLYDGANAVQELTAATPIANMLNGGLDKVLRRTDAGGSRSLLTDGQGSTLGLANDNGTLPTEYTYDPFGNTSSTGEASNNASKYTGREDDGTGLYYYRARYYSPSLQRFISQDPMGPNAGDTNLYAYVGNDPVNFIDPSGLCSVSLQDLQGLNRSSQLTSARQIVTRFNAAFTDFWNRLHANGGLNSCARFFGGVGRAEALIADTQFRFGTVGGDGGAQTNDKTVTIDPNGAFMAVNGRAPNHERGAPVDIRDNAMWLILGTPTKPGIIYMISPSDVEAASFILAHEMGHRAGAFGATDNDGEDFVFNMINNEKIRKACFPEFIPEPLRIR